MQYHVFETCLGYAAVAGRDLVSHLILPKESPDEAEQAALEAVRGSASRSDRDFSGLASAVTAYLEGEPLEFECELDPGCASEFDRLVWQAVRRIPYGSVWTYSAVAEAIGRPGAARAVGQALGRNPIPIIVPCHRVIRSDGGLGGFSAGLDWKERLLQLERIGSGR